MNKAEKSFEAVAMMRSARDRIRRSARQFSESLEREVEDVVFNHETIEAADLDGHLRSWGLRGRRVRGALDPIYGQ